MPRSSSAGVLGSNLTLTENVVDMAEVFVYTRDSDSSPPFPPWLSLSTAVMSAPVSSSRSKLGLNWFTRERLAPFLSGSPSTWITILSFWARVNV